MPTISELNDLFHKSIPNGRAYFTLGVIAPFNDLTLIVEQVRTYTNFNPHNDPYDEHYFSVFYVNIIDRLF
jgi:hypothetical protein